jgi:hypothetical protein
MRWLCRLGAIALVACCASGATLPLQHAGLRAWGGQNSGNTVDRSSPLRLRGGSIANLAAYTLLKMGGTDNPSPDDVK